MENKKNIPFMILGFFLPFIGAIISLLVKDNNKRLALKRGSVFSGLILFLFLMGVSFYYIGSELGRSK